MARLKVTRRECLFVVLAIALFFAIAEAGLRVYFHWFADPHQSARFAVLQPDPLLPKSEPLYRPYPYVGFTLNPKADPEINPLGLRGLLPASDDPESLVVVALGGSTTYGPWSRRRGQESWRSCSGSAPRATTRS